jgi:hypothetical protein
MLRTARAFQVMAQRVKLWHRKLRHTECAYYVIRRLRFPTATLPVVALAAGAVAVVAVDRGRVGRFAIELVAHAAGRGAVAVAVRGQGVVPFGRADLARLLEDHNLAAAVDDRQVREPLGLEGLGDLLAVFGRGIDVAQVVAFELLGVFRLGAAFAQERRLHAQLFVFRLVQNHEQRLVARAGFGEGVAVIGLPLDGLRCGTHGAQSQDRGR